MREIGIDLLAATYTQRGIGKGRGRRAGMTGIQTGSQVEITTAREKEEV